MKAVSESASASPLPLADVKEKLKALDGKRLGLIEANGVYAVRVKKVTLYASRKVLGLDEAIAWRLAGLPTSFDLVDVEAVLANLKWAAVPVPHSKRVLRGKPS